MKASLVIMAAGLGSRYGGTKQVEGVGPHGEILMEYAIYDALQAGFHKVVFIVKPEMHDLMDRLCGSYLRQKKALDGQPVEVVYADQDFASLPDFYAVPPDRTKPYGTVHALLCAEEVLHEPCCVINADDFYGAQAYQVMYDALQNLPAQGGAAMVGYLLKNTASLHGAVSRGVCTLENGVLKGVRETPDIQLYPDGSLKVLSENRALSPETVVSMNFWGFQPSIFPVMREYFHNFLRHTPGDPLKAECLLPVMADHLMKTGELSIQVLSSPDQWFGMTYQEDRALVREALRKLHASGAYPERFS